ncbi:MAG: family 10 glycosylhydrolase [bacterium]
MKRALLWFFLSMIPGTLLSQISPPKREFRGAWIATVINLDWPSSPFISPEAQRAELVRIFDELQAAGVNAALFQVRSEADAMYASALEPWSYWLTGAQGKPPAPFYDPLEVAVQEAHRRGMELHAWFNPYRVSRQVGNYANDPLHVSVQHPDWVIQISTIKILDPGLPQARGHITNVVMDVVNRYDVDGVHFDDYFYPYPPTQISNQDAATFANYNRGFTNIGDWRRDNVNLLIQAVHDSIQAVKPYVKLGMSPFGIWKNGVPPGITGLDAYSTIYCDAVAWLNRQIIDYVTPQLYWRYGGGQDYGKLMPWWATQTNGRHYYPGLAPFNISAQNWAANELPRQIRANRGNANVQGNVFFRTLILRENPKGFTDSLKTDLHRDLAFAPVMAWKDATAPQAPTNLRHSRLHDQPIAALQWDLPPAAADGDTASRYAIYNLNRDNIQPGDLEDARNLAQLAGDRSAQIISARNFHFAVTALDRNWNESNASSVLTIMPPAVPVLVAPEDKIFDQPNRVVLQWRYAEGAAGYNLQVSADSTFSSGLLFKPIGLSDTAFAVTGMEGQSQYYWRVQSQNVAGVSSYATPRSFATGFPATPALVSPSNNTGNIVLQPTLHWRRTTGALVYRLQLSKSLSFDSTAIVAELSDYPDTVYASPSLEPDRFYFWRVLARNQIGDSKWSEVFRFKTGAGTAVAENLAVPKEFHLYQNHPNPFNPVTTIRFDLPRAGAVRLRIFDALGREVLALLDQEMPAGQHEVPFDGRHVSSGVYYYRLEFQGVFRTRRMLLTK